MTRSIPHRGILPAAGRSRAFLEGLTGGLPFLLVVLPFGMLFGVVGTEAGLTLSQVMGFTVVVIAGASQFTTLQLLTDGAPAIVAIAAGLAVNMRMAMYSASLVPHLGRARLWQRALVAYGLVDQVYASSLQKYQDEPALPIRQKLAYFAGAFTALGPPWIAATYVGAVAGDSLTEGFALDFAMPITFIALVAPALRTLSHVVAAGVSVAIALGLAFLPFNLGLLIAAPSAMAAGVLTEMALERRQ